MKLGFFRQSVNSWRIHRSWQTVQQTFQTNGILIDEDWCVFFKEHNFLVGLNVDGPIAELVRRGRPPPDVMALIAAEDTKRGPNKDCPCASGRKFRFCHGDRTPPSPFSGVDSLKKRAP
jgi:hypothetical protein